MGTAQFTRFDKLRCKSRKFASLLTFLFAVLSGSCSQDIPAQVNESQVALETQSQMPLPGIYQITAVAENIRGQKVGVVANHTSLIDDTHLVDTLISRGIHVGRIFAPEHGFRGDKADGAYVENTSDPKTGVEVISLYGKNKKPQPDQLADLDVVIFDIQDVGARFYTFLSTLHYVMEACAERGIPLIVLDRPNPNAHYIDGPVLKSGFTSFVGMHPVPVVYGMTIAEYARMINGEKWLAKGAQCELVVVACTHYDHGTAYALPVKPSPNLPDMQSIYLYPSLCFFEGTTVSVGRGTAHPFKVIGEPTNSNGDFTFTPVPIKGASTSPPHNGVACRGYDLGAVDTPLSQIELQWLIRMYKETKNQTSFFLASGFFDKLAGTDQLRLDVISNKSEAEIRASWMEDLDRFKEVRSKYLIYE